VRVSEQEASPAAPEPEAPWKLQVYTGNGKGKTTCAVGLMIRALGAGLKVAFVQFDKGYHGEEHYAERHILRKLEGIDLFPTGCERMTPGGKFRFGVLPEDLAEARRGLEIVHDLIAHPRHQLVVLDEILSAIPYHLLKEEQVLEVLDRYEAAGRPFELVITGRKASEAIIGRADLVTEMRPVKHYFDAGLMARPGIEY
jgi:cob(I)alamin adenosyltransferase